MSATLEQQLDGLPSDVWSELSAHHFDRQRFLRLAARLGSETDNRVKGAVRPPAPGDVSDLPEPGSAEHERLSVIGRKALAEGSVALVVLAGGMATRMGGVVKALVEALPDKTFLELRLAEMDALAERVGRRAPLWLMTSAATDAATREALSGRLDGRELAIFRQNLSLRLTPEGNVFLDESGRPSLQASGHGDLPDALKESGLLSRFVNDGGRTLMIANLDNLGATLDEAVVGFHLDHGKAATCEVVDKVGTDKGGIPVRLDDRPVVLEEFRLPESFDPETVRVFNTNTFHVDARALLELQMDWTFFTVNKKVGGTPVVQFERLIGELTSHLETRFLRVPRTGNGSRFLPVKDHDELAARRAEIEAVARTRGGLK
ncbi:MAG: UTP--glucose-1-phosphate uridylyltransferase [Myxococcales bacterium]|nr:UTP--glucose-1-phosphate uridylyltransferase [Myxococcales bacterium]